MRWDQDLSPEQRNAASHYGQHARLLAGPGTGKTRALTSRVAYLVTELKTLPTSILTLTFTRAAAAELRSRLSALLQGVTQVLPQVSTLHSFALQSILRYGAGDRLPTPIRIADDYEERWIIEEDIKRLLDLERVDDARDLIQQLSADWEQLTADQEGWEARFPHPTFLGTWREHRMVFGYTLRAELVYQLKRALEEGAIELTDAPLHLLVDEYQDLNACDLSVIKSLTAAGAELYAAGDDDQSIYGFRYANPEGIRRFTDEYQPATHLTLAECHRCSQVILDAAVEVVQQDPRRLDKPLYPAARLPPGEVRLLRFDDFTDEAVGVARISRWLVESQGIPVDEILVLLRIDSYQWFSDPIRVAFEAAGLPATAIENPLAALEEQSGLVFLSLLRLLVTREDSLAWRTLLLKRRNNLGTGTCAAIYEIARSRGLTFYQAVQLICQSPSMVGRGALIKSEVEKIAAVLSELGDLDQENIGAIVDRILDRAVQEEQDPIREAISNVLRETAALSVGDLLKGIANPVGPAEQAKFPGSVNIMTMHKAKGLDAQAVFVVAAEDEYIPGKATGVQIEDERRLLYVSLTRAKTHLYITHCGGRTGAQRNTGKNPGSARRTLSQFLRGGSLVSTPANDFIGGLPN